MHLLKSVFWDLDGTIAETEISGHRIAFNKAFKDNSLNWFWDEKIYVDLLEIGGGKNRIKYYCNKLALPINDNLVDRIHSKKSEYYQEIMKKGNLPLRKGVIRLMTELTARNVSQWIVTTSTRKSVDILIATYLKNNNIRLDGIITSDDVQLHKPHPEAYLLALSLSNSSKENSIVIEDSSIGLAAAKSAGLKCVITLSPWLNYLPSKMSKADLVVDSLGDFNNKFKVFYGHTSEDVVNYNCLKALNDICSK
ncbi:HAD-IA family hydrolase [Prochlorococcus marinus]|uniref:HAD-IA family hydrolase n=1 Tax=Prochlorococcus marinus TaxID=1219 RepID=UPI0022B4A33A|nr:HAD-IA family hydrolase [Prochlorococcus marinus]